MKIAIDYTLCEGHAVCLGLAPSVFDLGDDDEQVQLLVDTPDDSVAGDVVLAAKRCPVSAIKLSE